MMMRHSQKVRTKGKRSFREKQVPCTYQLDLIVAYQVLMTVKSKTVLALELKCFLSCLARSPRRPPEKEEAVQVGQACASCWSSAGHHKSEL